MLKQLLSPGSIQTLPTSVVFDDNKKGENEVGGVSTRENELDGTSTQGELADSAPRQIKKVKITELDKQIEANQVKFDQQMEKIRIGKEEIARKRLESEAVQDRIIEEARKRLENEALKSKNPSQPTSKNQPIISTSAQAQDENLKAKKANSQKGIDAIEKRIAERELASAKLAAQEKKKLMELKGQTARIVETVQNEQERMNVKIYGAYQKLLKTMLNSMLKKREKST